MMSALRGVPSKADIVSNLSKGGCMNLRTRGEGVKKSEIFVDVIYGSPLMLYCMLTPGCWVDIVAAVLHRQ